MATPTMAEMSAAFTFPEPAQKRAGLTLVDRVQEIELIVLTLEQLEEEGITDELRRELEHELFVAICGTKEKVDKVSHVLGTFAAAEAHARAEIVRLQARVAYFSRQHERLTRYCVATMEATGMTKLQGSTSTLALRRNPPSVAIDCEAAIPAEFWRVPPAPAPVPNKTAIKAAILAGSEVPGCRVTSEFRLVRS